jgi:hypothetical protein
MLSAAALPRSSSPAGNIPSVLPEVDFSLTAKRMRVLPGALPPPPRLAPPEPRASPRAPEIQALGRGQRQEMVCSPCLAARAPPSLYTPRTL